VGDIGLSRVVAHAEQLDDGVVAAGHKQCGQVVVFTLLTPAA
jgi:hypothetical protein